MFGNYKMGRRASLVKLIKWLTNCIRIINCVNKFKKEEKIKGIEIISNRIERRDKSLRTGLLNFVDRTLAIENINDLIVIAVN